MQQGKIKTTFIQISNKINKITKYSRNDREIIYNSLCKNIIFYCATILEHRLDNTHMKRNLRATQRYIIIHLENLVKTTSYTSTITLTKHLPIDYEIINKNIIYIIKNQPNNIINTLQGITFTKITEENKSWYKIGNQDNQLE